MNVDDAEEYTAALGQIVAGGWRQVALGERLGVPAALGLTTRDWVEDRLGGYIRLSLPERREAVHELAANGMTQREIADVIGVSQKTVSRDAESSDSAKDIDQAQPDPNESSDSGAADLLERAAAVADLIETVKTERRPEPPPGIPAHPTAAFLWARLSEVRALNAKDAAPDQRPDIKEAVELWLGELERLQEEMSR